MLCVPDKIYPTAPAGLIREALQHPSKSSRTRRRVFHTGCLKGRKFHHTAQRLYAPQQALAETVTTLLTLSRD